MKCKLILCCAILGLSTPAFAEDGNLSANVFLPGCKAMINDRAKNIAEGFNAGACYGTAVSLEMILTSLLPEACQPKDVTPMQTIRVITKYIDDQPARLNENFFVLATEAITKAWSCPSK